MHTQSPVESALNFALITQDTNELDHIRRQAHELSRQNIVDLIEALHEAFDTIEAKDCEIGDLQEGIEIATDCAQEMKESLTALKENIVELNEAKLPEVSEVTEKINDNIETLADILGAFTDEMSEFQESDEEPS